MGYNPKLCNWFEISKHTSLSLHFFDVFMQVPLHDTWFHVYSILCFGLEFLLSIGSKSFELPKVWSSCVVLHLDSICLVFFLFWSCLAQENFSGKCHAVVFFEVCTFWFVFEFATIWNCSEGGFLLCFLSWRSSLGNFDVFGFHFHLKLLWKLNPNKV